MANLFNESLTDRIGEAGVIAVDAAGNLDMNFNSEGMFRGAADSGGRFQIGIWESLRSP